MSLIQALIKEAKARQEAAECNFNNACGKDVDVAIAELNAAEMRLNRVLELAKEELN